MDINEILAEVGISVPDEKVQAFNKLVRTNYKSVAEVNKLRGDIDSLKEQVTKLSDENNNLVKGSKDVATVEDTYKNKVSELETKLNEYESKIKDYEITNVIKGYFKDTKFISKRVEDSVINEIKNKNFELKDGKLEGIDDYIKSLKEEGNVFQETQAKKVFMHTGNQRNDNNTRQSTFLSSLYDGIEVNKEK